MLPRGGTIDDTCLVRDEKLRPWVKDMSMTEGDYAALRERLWFYIGGLQGFVMEHPGMLTTFASMEDSRAWEPIIANTKCNVLVPDEDAKPGQGKKMKVKEQSMTLRELAKLM
eukprot:g18561.t1